MYERRDPEPAAGTAARSGPSPILIGLIVVAVIALVFVLQNGNEADIDFLFFDVQSPVWIAIAIAIGVGVLLDRLFIAWWRRRRSRSDA